MDLVVCILVFCDAICLLSDSIEEMQLLLNLCEEFAMKWGIEFNLEKCKYIVFGKKKYNNIILKLNNQLISFTDCFKYLGLEFNTKLDMSVKVYTSSCIFSSFLLPFIYYLLFP